jgi:hypothetical protein
MVQRTGPARPSARSETRDPSSYSAGEYLTLPLILKHLAQLFATPEILKFSVCPGIIISAAARYILLRGQSSANISAMC